MQVHAAQAQPSAQVSSVQLAHTEQNVSIDESNYQNLKSGIFIGLVLAMVCVMCISYTLNRNSLLLLNSLFLSSLLMVSVVFSGIGARYLWLNQPSYQQYAIYLFSCLAIVFSSLATSKNLAQNFSAQGIIRFFQATAISSLLLIPITLLVSNQTSFLLILIVAVITFAGHIFIGVINWKNQADAQYESNLGLLILFIALMFIAINTYSSIDLFVSNLALLQLSILALASLMLLSTIKNTTVSSDAFGSQEDYQDKDLQLSEQMLELQFALKELQEKNEQLEKLSTLDELSGIHNRRYFDKRLLAELRRGRRELLPLSLIMFDIDHFKKFNDTYGHIAGDEVIRSVAFSASKQLNRETDEIFRYGGEEFAIVLPNTELEGALFIAEKVRETIEKLIINCAGQTLSCTISLGVACHQSKQAIQPTEFIEQADKALYQAKQEGRNRVVQYK